MCVRLPIKEICRDPGIQSRPEINQDVIEDYAERMAAGAKFPPSVVFDDGRVKWLAEGFHRVPAEELNGFIEARVELRHGTRRDALMHSLTSNSLHGLRRSAADKRRAIDLLLADPEWAKRSDRCISQLLSVSDHTVAEVRASLSTAHLRSSEPAARVGKDGKSRAVKPSSLIPVPNMPITNRNEPEPGNGRERKPKSAPKADEPVVSATGRARRAIAELELIPADDPGRDRAIEMVTHWIANHS